MGVGTQVGAAVTPIALTRVGAVAVAPLTVKSTPMKRMMMKAMARAPIAAEPRRSGAASWILVAAHPARRTLRQVRAPTAVIQAMIAVPPRTRRAAPRGRTPKAVVGEAAAERGVGPDARKQRPVLTVGGVAAVRLPRTPHQRPLGLRLLLALMGHHAPSASTRVVSSASPPPGPSRRTAQGPGRRPRRGSVGAPERKARHAAAVAAPPTPTARHLRLQRRERCRPMRPLPLPRARDPPLARHC